ncbi:MAG: 3-oxoacid CoA-transferase subunit A [Clostridiales bacterium]|nr:3-oxoacid CoA-transferase subunit A [Clostridiales bacterium]
MKKIKSVEEALSYIKPGMTIMVGGFLGVGSPELLIDAIIERKIGDLTLIANDTSFPDQNYGKLVVNKLIKKVITSHIGTNPESGLQMHSGEMEIILTPQGTLVEQIRAGGAGLGGVITPTGLGTVVEDGKQKIEIDGKSFLVEKPLRADVALLRGAKVDRKGNICYDLAARNFNPIMAMAADIVIVEADEIVETGEIDPNFVMTPHIFVDVIVKGGK